MHSNGVYAHRREPGYFMLRTTQPGGAVTAEQAKLIAEISDKQNKGFVDITARQNFQLHWCHEKELPEIFEQLASAGVSTRGAAGDTARNVVSCPVSGVDTEELGDAGSVVAQLHELFQQPEFADLPRKFKAAVSGCRAQCAQPDIHDVALVGTQQGFDLRVGGGLSTQPFLSQRMGAFVTAEQAVEVVAAIVRVWSSTPEYRQQRGRARLKYLVNDWGVTRLRQAVEERLGKTLSDADPHYQDAPEQFRDHVGVHAQKQDGFFYIGAPVLAGRITSAQLSRVADLAQRYSDPNKGSAPIRLTNRQNLVLLHVSEVNVEKVLAGLADAGLSINAHPIRRSVMTCTGAEFCTLAITETKARSREIVEYLEQRILLEEPLRLHISGCDNACAQYQIAHIGLLGTKATVDGQEMDAYDVLVGGQLGQGARFARPLMRQIPASDCKVRLEQLLQGYKKSRKPGESFNAWAARAGDAELVTLLGARQPAHSEEAEVTATDAGTS